MKRPMLDRIQSLKDLVVINDEAHHVHEEELQWHKTIIAIHEAIQSGLALWLDFSATPKDQNGTYFPWIICDYPLAQAVEDRIVKAPLIVHQVGRDDPDQVTRKNAIEAYGEWLIAGIERWKEHYETYKGLGKKPVLFIMAEQNNIIVSVLMLREGWDVRNVTIVLGLRPFSAMANILPEQAVGRGLRFMHGISPDSTQTLEVMGTKNFEDVVRKLEKEGVGIKTVTKSPRPAIKIEPVLEKSAYDITIPLTELVYTHNYKPPASFLFQDHVQFRGHL